MQILDCGCEVSDDKTRVLSQCSLHAVHMHVRMQAMEHPRAQEQARERDLDLEKKLVLAGFPVVLARRPPGHSDPNTTAEDLFAHVREVMRRLE